MGESRVACGSGEAGAEGGGRPVLSGAILLLFRGKQRRRGEKERSEVQRRAKHGGSACLPPSVQNVVKTVANLFIYFYNTDTGKKKNTTQTVAI